eukprot:Hpha_TRINITY_DN30226_c0_g1::TRINITY_DN30226_c0_g1_i1::g.27223::m.27223
MRARTTAARHGNAAGHKRRRDNRSPGTGIFDGGIGGSPGGNLIDVHAGPPAISLGGPKAKPIAADRSDGPSPRAADAVASPAFAPAPSLPPLPPGVQPDAPGPSSVPPIPRKRNIGEDSPRDDDDEEGYVVCLLPTPDPADPGSLIVERTKLRIGYCGDAHDGKQNGWGAQVFENGDVYRGEWKDGKIQGYGCYIYNNGSSYVGDFVASQRHGWGTWTPSPGSSAAAYEGQW